MIASGRFARRVVAAVEVAHDQVVELGDIAVGRGFSVTGHVRDEQGAPVAGANVAVMQGFAGDDGDEVAQLVRGNVATTSDDAGRYELDRLGARSR